MNVKIYSKPEGQCPYCEKAKKFFKSKKIAYEEIIVGIDITEENFRNLTNMTTKPAIYLNDNLIGGYTDLVEYVVNNQEVFN